MKNLKNKNVLVYGMSSSGIWASKLLKKFKANLFLLDDNPNKLSELGITNCTLLSSINEDIVKILNLIIVSPAIEKSNKIFPIASKYNVKIVSELEFASWFCGQLVAVTGTNGKTTTVELITAILNTKRKSIACGNIGYPLSKAVLKNKSSIKVAEVSSFMLENATTFHPSVATILNIKPDHLTRHKTMQEYKRLKLNIFNNLTSKDYVVVNLDEGISVPTQVKQLTYSHTKNATVRVKDGSIYLKGEKLIDINQLKIKGKHNISNVMCAICYACIFKVNPNKIKQVLKNFTPNDFRNQLIASVNGIRFINDSKSTNIASTLASTESNKGALVLILCGSNKELDYAELFQKLTKRVKLIVAFGEISNQIELANNQKFKLMRCENLTQAIEISIQNALAGDTVLFSPSSASYDQFENYIQRGKAFNEKVKEYEIKQTQK